MATERIAASLERISTVRGLTKNFLNDLEPDEWFWMPEQGITHVAWQVGHIAFAEYALCMKRLRGERAEDEQLISAEVIKLFGRGSTPVAGAENYPSQAELLALMDNIHAATTKELAGYTDEELDVPTETEHPMFKKNLGALEWCAEHEGIHIGQMILLRRMMGKSPKF